VLEYQQETVRSTQFSQLSVLAPQLIFLWFTSMASTFTFTQRVIVKWDARAITGISQVLLDTLMKPSPTFQHVMLLILLMRHLKQLAIESGVMRKLSVLLAGMKW